MKEFLFSATKECVEHNNLTSTMKQGIIALLPEPGEDYNFIKCGL